MVFSALPGAAFDVKSSGAIVHFEKLKEEEDSWWKWGEMAWNADAPKAALPELSDRSHVEPPHDSKRKNKVRTHICTTRHFV